MVYFSEKRRIGWPLAPCEGGQLGPTFSRRERNPGKSAGKGGNPLKSLELDQKCDLDFVSLDLDFRPPGLEYLRRGLEILPHFLEILPAHGPPEPEKEPGIETMRSADLNSDASKAVRATGGPEARLLASGCGRLDRGSMFTRSVTRRCGVRFATDPPSSSRHLPGASDAG